MSDHALIRAIEAAQSTAALIRQIDPAAKQYGLSARNRGSAWKVEFAYTKSLGFTPISRGADYTLTSPTKVAEIILMNMQKEGVT